MQSAATGFTGTQRGLTRGQRASLVVVIGGLAGWLHHGDCVGSDDEAHDIAVAARLWVAIHPPRDARLRAGRTGDLVFPTEEYLVRNRIIVDMTRALIAAPAGMAEELRSGTWSTVRYARRCRRPITLVMPDGSVRQEAGQ